jgi:hypothetical protein
MDSDVQTYPIISLPANKYRIFTEENLETANPTEYVPSNEKILFNNVADYNYPGISAAISLATDDFRSYLQPNTPNPPETASNSQIFHTTNFYELSYGEYPNAFRYSQSSEPYSTIPDIAANRDLQAEINSKYAELDKLYVELRKREKRRGQTDFGLVEPKKGKSIRELEKK